MEYRPAAEMLAHLELVPLGEKVQALDAVVLVKALDDEGRVGWYTRYTDSLTTVEVLGALRAAELLEEERVLALYRSVGTEDE